MKNLYLVFLFYFLYISTYSQTTIVNSGSSWKYKDDGVYPGIAWNLSTYSDATWSNGNAELGYGDGDENTTVSYGPSSSSKYITTWFRKTFFVADPTLFSSLNLELLKDDGAIVYINGVEVVRSNMPSGAVNDLTLASGTVAWPFEDDWDNYTLSALHLTAGNNILAVEIHQDDASSSDISFDLKLTGVTSSISANVVRGPYLQKVNPTSITVKWRTDVATDSKIFYGTSLSSLTSVAVNTDFTTEHEVQLTGLLSNQKYFYKIGHSTGDLTVPGTDYYFKTSPNEGEHGKYRFWAIGDAGTGNDNQRAVRDAFSSYNQNKHVDGWIWLGDNAYEGGFDSEYQSNVFSNNTYEELLKHIVVWPAPGNHDYNNHIPFSPAPAYYDIFSLPANGECGGVPSFTEKYYSYNYGNIHFIVLDSFDEGRDISDAMATWLNNDLNSNSLPWVIVYWHHPPYTKGSHDSDNPIFIDGELEDMRENIVPILENHGVDLVLNGHSHSYERTYFLNGHYGLSSTFNTGNIVQEGTGDYISDCPYRKNDSLVHSNNGTIYAVVGCSGKTSSVDSDWPHNAMVSYYELKLGSMLIEVDENRLDAKFITSDTTVLDQFTIVKNAGKNTTVNLCPGEEKTLMASWPGQHIWYPGGITVDTLNITASIPTFYTVTDSLNCISDTISINILSSPPCLLSTNENNTLNVNVYQTESEFVIELNSQMNSIQFSLFSLIGELIVQHNFNNSGSQNNVSKSGLSSGMYLYTVVSNGKYKNGKIIVK